MTNAKKQLIYKAIREGRLFEYIASRAYEMSKWELEILAKELAYSAEHPNREIWSTSQLREDMISELEDYWCDCDDEEGVD